MSSRIGAVTTRKTGSKRGRKRIRTCDDPAGGESGGRLHGRLGGRSRTGLARSRTIRDFHGVPRAISGKPTRPTLRRMGCAYARGRGKPPLPHSMPRTAAFFDLDKTVIAKSSTLTFSKSFYQGGLINRRGSLRTAYAQFVFLAGGADHDQMERMREYLSALCRGWNVQLVKEPRRRDPARPDRPDHLRRGRLPDRGAPHRRPRRRDRLHVGRRGRRADRRAARRGPGGGDPHDRGRRRLLHGRWSTTRTAPPRRRRSRSWPSPRVRPDPLLLPTATRRPTCRCWSPSDIPTR